MIYKMHFTIYKCSAISWIGLNYKVVQIIFTNNQVRVKLSLFHILRSMFVVFSWNWIHDCGTNAITTHVIQDNPPQFDFTEVSIFWKKKKRGFPNFFLGSQYLTRTVKNSCNLLLTHYSTWRTLPMLACSGFKFKLRGQVDFPIPFI